MNRFERHARKTEKELRGAFWMFVIASIITAAILICSTLRAQPLAIHVDSECAIAFSPRGGITDMIVDRINFSKKSIRLLGYNFTSSRIAIALMAAQSRGVDVQLVLDRSVKTEKNSQLPRLLAAGIPVWIDRKHHIAHNKTIIFDDSVFETGSFNFTDSAESNNAENALICPSESGAAAYTADWEKHRDHSVRIYAEDRTK